MSETIESRAVTLGIQTRITFQLLALLATPLLGLILIWFKIDAMQRELRGQWTIAHQIVWAERLKGGNPDLLIPDVESVVRAIENGRKR